MTRKQNYLIEKKSLHASASVGGSPTESRDYLPHFRCTPVVTASGFGPRPNYLNSSRTFVATEGATNGNPQHTRFKDDGRFVLMPQKIWIVGVHEPDGSLCGRESRVGTEDTHVGSNGRNHGTRSEQWWQPCLPNNRRRRGQTQFAPVAGRHPVGV